MSNALPVLAEVRRGPIVESWHHGVIVIADPDGKIMLSYGDADLITSTRSTIKPIQALPLITSGAADHYQLTPRELAAAMETVLGPRDAAIDAVSFAALRVRFPDTPAN